MLNNVAATDRSQIPQEHRPIVDTMTSLLVRCQQQCPPNQKKPLEDSAKKLNLMFDKLADRSLSPHVVGQMLNMTKSLFLVPGNSSSANEHASGRGARFPRRLESARKLNHVAF